MSTRIEPRVQNPVAQVANTEPLPPLRPKVSLREQSTFESAPRASRHGTPEATPAPVETGAGVFTPSSLQRAASRNIASATFASPANQHCGGPTSGAGYDGENLSPSALFSACDQAAADYDLPPEVMRAIAMQESGGTQWNGDGSVSETDDGNGTIDWGVMQLNTEGWLGSDLDMGRAKTDERYNIEMSAKELRTASDYWFTQKYGHPFTTAWYDSLSPAGQKEARVDLFRAYNGWLPDTSNAAPYEAQIDDGNIGTVSGKSSSSGTSSSSNKLAAPTTNLNFGDTGAQVEQLQRDLVKLGYLTQADMNTGPGIYGPHTQAAVQKFQQAHQLSPATGNCGPKTRAALATALEPKKSSSSKSSSKSKSTSSSTSSTKSSALTAPSKDLKYGDSGADVKTLQSDLVALGYLSKSDTDAAKGKYDAKTRKALAAFQHDQGWSTSADGSGYGPKTRAALKEALKLAAQVPAHNLKLGATGDDVKALQTLLVKLGYLSQADMDTGQGIYGPHTEAALAALQHDAGYPDTDGSGYGPKTRAALTHDLAVNATAIAGTSSSTATGGKINSTSQANAYFTNQWSGTAYNTEGVWEGNSDCGPTSTLMIASSLGLCAPPNPATAEDQIDHIRDLAMGYDTTAAIPDGTDEGEMANAISQLGGSTQYLDMSTSEVDQALSSGERVLIAGDPWNAWGAQMDASGEYLNHSDPGPHFVAILGKTAAGEYIVGDPLSGVGTITITAAQLQEFWNDGGGESGAMAVGR